MILLKLEEKCKNLWDDYIFNVDSSCSFWIKEKEEISDCINCVCFFVILVYVSKVNKWRDQVIDILVKITVGKIAISRSIIYAHMNSYLVKFILCENKVEEWLHINATILISIKLQKCRSTKEMPEFKRKIWSNS